MFISYYDVTSFKILPIVVQNKTNCIFEFQTLHLLEMGDPDTTRLEYTIKACSTEAPGHPAENLSNFTTSGWRSCDLCDYPQSIICKLATEAELRRIQLLGHNFLIPQRVVLYVGNFHNKYEKHIWKKIGFVTFSGFYR